MELKTKTISKEEQVLEVTEQELFNAMADASAELMQQYVEETHAKDSSVEIISLVTATFSAKLMKKLFNKKEEEK